MSQRKLKKIRKEIEILKNSGSEQDISNKVALRVTLKKIIKDNFLWLLLMTVVIIGIYFNSLWGNFVSDDYASIPQNPYIDNFWYMFGKGNSMGFSTYLMKQIVGFGSSVPFHLMAVINFIIFCWVAYIFLEIVFKDKWLTRVTMFLFALHPIHAEAVSWISGRIYLILGLYTMIAFIGFIFFVKNNNPKYLLITLVAFILGFLTDRPRPFVILLLIIIYLLYVGFNKIKIDWAKFTMWAVAITILFVIFAIPYIKFRIGVVNSGYNSSESIFYNPFFQYPTGISKYLQLLFFPVDLTLYHTMYTFPVWLNWIILINYFILVVYFFFKDKRYFFALAFIVVAVLPSIMPVKVSWLVAERYIFLGSLGFCLFLALIIIGISKYKKWVAAIIFVCLVFGYGVRLFLRNIDWQTNHNLWVNTCQMSPNSHNAWNNIGDDYDKLNDPTNAIKGFTQSTIVKPNYADAYHNRANIFFKTGRLDLARDSYSTALNFSPGLYQTYLSLTQIDLMENNISLAMEHARKAVEIDPSNPQAAYVLAVVYAQGGRAVEAEALLSDILKKVPDYQPAVQALKQLKMATGVTK